MVEWRGAALSCQEMGGAICILQWEAVLGMPIATTAAIHYIHLLITTSQPAVFAYNHKYVALLWSLLYVYSQLQHLCKVQS